MDHLISALNEVLAACKKLMIKLLHFIKMFGRFGNWWSCILAVLAIHTRHTK